MYANTRTNIHTSPPLLSPAQSYVVPPVCSAAKATASTLATTSLWGSTFSLPAGDDNDDDDADDAAAAPITTTNTTRSAKGKERARAALKPSGA
jgi:hypothetical protein